MFDEEEGKKVILVALRCGLLVEQTNAVAEHGDSVSTQVSGIFKPGS